MQTHFAHACELEHTFFLPFHAFPQLFAIVASKTKFLFLYLLRDFRRDVKISKLHDENIEFN